MGDQLKAISAEIELNPKIQDFIKLKLKKTESFEDLLKQFKQTDQNTWQEGDNLRVNVKENYTRSIENIDKLKDFGREGWREEPIKGLTKHYDEFTSSLRELAQTSDKKSSLDKLKELACDIQGCKVITELLVYEQKTFAKTCKWIKEDIYYNNTYTNAIWNDAAKKKLSEIIDEFNIIVEDYVDLISTEAGYYVHIRRLAAERELKRDFSPKINGYKETIRQAVEFQGKFRQDSTRLIENINDMVAIGSKEPCDVANIIDATLYKDFDEFLGYYVEKGSQPDDYKNGIGNSLEQIKRVADASGKAKESYVWFIENSKEHEELFGIYQKDIDQLYKGFIASLENLAKARPGGNNFLSVKETGLLPLALQPVYKSRFDYNPREYSSAIQRIETCANMIEAQVNMVKNMTSKS